MRSRPLLIMLFAAIGVVSCDDDRPAPDYHIDGQLPFDIKVLEGVRTTVVKEISVHDAGNVPGQTNVRIPMPANVALAVPPLPAAISATFVGAAAGRPPFNARLEIIVPNTAPRGTYDLKISGTAPPVAPKTETTHKIRIYSPLDGGAWVEIKPSEISIAPGETKNVVVTVTRIPPYVGNATVTYPGAGSNLPTGVTVIGTTTRTSPIGPGADVVVYEFSITAADGATGYATVSAEVATGAPGAVRTDTAPHTVSVR